MRICTPFPITPGRVLALWARFLPGPRGLVHNGPRPARRLLVEECLRAWPCLKECLPALLQPSPPVLLPALLGLLQHNDLMLLRGLLSLGRGNPLVLLLLVFLPVLQVPLRATPPALLLRLLLPLVYLLVPLLQPKPLVRLLLRQVLPAALLFPGRSPGCQGFPPNKCSMC